MKFIISLLILTSVVSVGSSVSDTCGDNIKISGDFTALCYQDPDGSLHVILNCNSIPKTSDNMEISYEFPEIVTSLTIQNCSELTLKQDILPTSGFQLNHLHLLNISSLNLTDGLNSFSYQPKKVTFQNIAALYFESPIVSDMDHKIEGMTLEDVIESLEFINVTMTDLSEHFINIRPLKSHRHKDLGMKGKVFNLETGSMFINSKKSVITIINSTIGDMKHKFINANVFQIIISGSTFQGFSTEKALQTQADRVSFSGNQITSLSSNSLDIRSNDIVISSNVFTDIKKDAFRLVAFANDNSLKSYEFSNNVIYSIEPKASVVPFRDVNSGKNLTDIIIYNNSVNCNDWIESIAFYCEWSSKDNLNKCLKGSEMNDILCENISEGQPKDEFAKKTTEFTTEKENLVKEDFNNFFLTIGVIIIILLCIAMFYFCKSATIFKRNSKLPLDFTIFRKNNEAVLSATESETNPCLGSK